MKTDRFTSIMHPRGPIVVPSDSKSNSKKIKKDMKKIESQLEKLRFSKRAKKFKKAQKSSKKTLTLKNLRLISSSLPFISERISKKKAILFHNDHTRAWIESERNIQANTQIPDDVVLVDEDEDEDDEETIDGAEYVTDSKVSPNFNREAVPRSEPMALDDEYCQRVLERL